MSGRMMAITALALFAAMPALAQQNWGGGDPRWGGRHGPRGPAIVLFSKPGFQGHSYFTDHEVRKLSTKDMDDKVSSIRVMGGVWQVCVDDKFEGRCEIVDHSMPDTRVINMDDKISSVRPVPPGGPGWRR